MSKSVCKRSCSCTGAFQSTQNFFLFFPCYSPPSLLFIYISYLNNSHCLLFSLNVPPKRPMMSDCSHQMDSWMQQVGQMAKRPVWCCLPGHGLPFPSRYIIIILTPSGVEFGGGVEVGHWQIFSMQFWKNHKLPAALLFPMPHPPAPATPTFYYVAFGSGSFFWRLWWRLRNAFLH